MVRLGPALVLAAAFAVVPGLAWADGPSADNVKAAAAHFQKARDMFQNGAYKDAITELEVALSLDPTAKDLVYNLGVLSEKLGRIDDAIRYFKRYVEMDVDSGELAKGEGFIKRLEGAKKELGITKIDDEDDTHVKKATKILDKPPPAAKSNASVSAVLVTGTVLAVIGIGIGTGFGIKAMADKPADGTVTSATGPTYNAFSAAAASSHGEAIGADVALGVGVAAALFTLFFYVGTRPRAPIYLAQAPRLIPRLSPVFGQSTTGFALTGTF